ncbi:MAG: flavodoxin [Bdellovibrionota bacterium]
MKGSYVKSSKSLVVYYSRSGHTKALAQKICSAMGADIEEIKTPVSYGSGPLGYMKALFHSFSQRAPEILPLSRSLKDYGLVIVGGPMWGSGPAAPVRSFLDAHKDELQDVAFFATQGGSIGRSRLFQKMQAVCLHESLATLATSERDLMDGSTDAKLESFVKQLGQRAEESRAAM